MLVIDLLSRHALGLLTGWSLTLCCFGRIANAGEVRVVLELEKHALFDRDGSSANLLHTAKISVLESLVGCAVTVKALSGKEFNVPVTDVVSYVAQQSRRPAIAGAAATIARSAYTQMRFCG